MAVHDHLNQSKIGNYSLKLLLESVLPKSNFGVARFLEFSPKKFYPIDHKTKIGLEQTKAALK